MQMTKMIARILTFLCVATIALLVLIVFTQVVSRMFNYSLPGTEELSRLMIVWLTFLGTSLAIHEKLHLAVTFFVKKVRVNIQKWIYFFVHILTILFFGILLVYGFKLTASSMGNLSPTLQLPMSAFYAAIPVSSIFSIYFISTHMFESTAEGDSVA